MSVTAHERPGVYSSYDASSVVRRSQGSRVIGIAARAAKGTVGEVVTVTGFESGLAAFGAEGDGTGMTGLLRILYENGASEVKAVRVADSGTTNDYTSAFQQLTGCESVRIVVTDSAAVERDPALPVNGAGLRGIGGTAASLTEGEIDSLVRGGVTPLESLGGVTSPIRGITTKTKTGGAADASWREITTILIVDDVIPTLRESLGAKFLRSKNTARNRGAIRAQVIVELERKREAEIIEGYGEVTARASEDDPTVCEVEFPFAVAHGLNQIYLTAHITV